MNWNLPMATDKRRYRLCTRNVYTHDFSKFVEDQSVLVQFFRGLISDIEKARGIHDYTLMLFNGQNTFRVKLYVGEKTLRHQISEHGCIHCSLDLPVYPLINPELVDQECVLSGECGLSEFRDHPHVRCSIMRSTAPGFVITPIRHVTSLSHLRDDELSAVWIVAVRALQGFPFKFMKLHTTAYRLSLHLLLAVTVEYESHKLIRETWNMLEMDVWNRLQKLQKFRVAPSSYYDLVENGEDGGTCNLMRKEGNEHEVCHDEPSRSAANVQEKSTHTNGSLVHLERIKDKHHLVFQVRVAPGADFCKLLEDKSAVVGFFREIITEIEEKRGIYDYKLRLAPHNDHIGLLVDDLRARDRLPAEDCVICHLELPICQEIPQVIHQDCVLSEFTDEPHVRCFMKYSLPGFLITPIRHVSSLSQLEEDELYALGSVARRVLQPDCLPFKFLNLYSRRHPDAPHLLMMVGMDDETYKLTRKHLSTLKELEA